MLQTTSIKSNLKTRRPRDPFSGLLRTVSKLSFMLWTVSIKHNLKTWRPRGPFLGLLPKQMKFYASDSKHKT